MININIEKAKELKKNKLRQERAEILKQLDVDFMRALEAGDTAKVQEISAKKQALRDCTNHPDLVQAGSVEDLKQITIDSILGE
jgi:hypothetical protein